jgi:hypothetical protein
MLASEIAHAYSFLTRCKNSVEKRRDRSAAWRLGCKDMVVAPDLPAHSAVCSLGQTLAATLTAIFCIFAETFVSLTQAALPLPASLMATTLFS